MTYRKAIDWAVSQLSWLAAKLPKNPKFLQGAGGNVSIKTEYGLLIKASGYRFADVERGTGIVLLDNDGSVRDPATRKPTDLRPSMEYLMHFEAPSTVTVHLHSVGAVAHSIREDSNPSSRHGPQLLPYATPGEKLAGVVRGYFKRKRSSPSRDDCWALVLQQHGNLVGAPDVRSALEEIMQFESRMGNHSSLEAPSLEDMLKPRWFLEPRNLQALELLSQGFLTPDHAVFFENPIFGDSPDAYVSLKGGSLSQERRFTSAQEEIFVSLLVALSLALRADSGIKFIDQKEVLKLRSLEAEKYRLGLFR